jgi:DNA-binding CsgD family transcriptional regulator
VCRRTLIQRRVARQLCAGSEPIEIADEQGVALSTLRTQIGSIRAKAGHKSVRALLHTLARLPGMSTALAVCDAVGARPLSDAA